jgi:ABC-2 type transport system ATP-binding protein
LPDNPNGASGAIVVVDRLVKSFPIMYGIMPAIKHFGRIPRREVLHGISLSVRRGELFGLLGANGAGKTTLLKMLATLSIPDSGTIHIDGINAVRNPMAAKRRIGLCTSEERSFYFRLSARQNLEFFGTLMGVRGNALNRRIQEVVEMVDLGSAIDRPFSGFSSGMRQRLTVARALISDPPVLFFDEPTRAVYPVHAEELRRLMRDYLVGELGKTLVLATNLLDEAWALCDTIAVLKQGLVVACGPPNSLDTNFTRMLRYQIVIDQLDEALVARAKALAGLSSFASSESAEGFVLDIEIAPSERSLTELLSAVSSNGATVRALRSETVRPIDIFSDLVRVTDNDE